MAESGDIVRQQRDWEYEQRTAAEDLLGSIYLYVHWYDVSKRLTTEQREAWADAIEANSARINAGADERPMTVPRWWRDDYVPARPQPKAPSRRVTLELTAYLSAGAPSGGWYDMQSSPDGGETFSIPAFVVDEDTVRDAPAEQLTGDDWDEIEGHVRARLGDRRAGEILRRWRATAVREAEGAIDG